MLLVSRLLCLGIILAAFVASAISGCGGGDRDPAATAESALEPTADAGRIAAETSTVAVIPAVPVTPTPAPLSVMDCDEELRSRLVAGAPFSGAAYVNGLITRIQDSVAGCAAPQWGLTAFDPDNSGSGEFTDCFGFDVSGRLTVYGVPVPSGFLGPDGLPTLVAGSLEDGSILVYFDGESGGYAGCWLYPASGREWIWAVPAGDSPVVLPVPVDLAAAASELYDCFRLNPGFRSFYRSLGPRYGGEEAVEAFDLLFSDRDAFVRSFLAGALEEDGRFADEVFDLLEVCRAQ